MFAQLVGRKLFEQIPFGELLDDSLDRRLELLGGLDDRVALPSADPDKAGEVVPGRGNRYHQRGPDLDAPTRDAVDLELHLMGGAGECKTQMARIESAPANADGPIGLVQHKLVGFPKPV